MNQARERNQKESAVNILQENADILASNIGERYVTEKSKIKVTRQ